ncbi:LysR substrate-binding domain-containing protein [Paenibacillus thalictri]|uniref:LysR substrate-binding domain-containing protein n=1 Tax=Paenibacillus thalictri TaxID=2527873 RepID=UPI0014782FA0
MDIRHLQYVIEVAMTGSFTKAAESLHISQPTISKAVKEIEDELGVILFDRTGKKAELTSEGYRIVSQARDIVGSFNSLTSEVNQAAHLHKGKLRIGLPPMAGAGFFPELIGKFHEQYPGIMLELVEYGAKRLAADIESGALDFGAVLLPVNRDLYHSILIAEERLMLIVHPEHPLASRAEVPMEELSEESFILFREDFALNERIPAACISAGFQPRIVCESSQWDLIGSLVGVKLGISLMPEHICKKMNPAAVTSVPLVNPIIPWRLGFIWRKDRYLSFAAKEWIRFLQSKYAGKADI